MTFDGNTTVWPIENALFGAFFFYLLEICLVFFFYLLPRLYRRFPSLTVENALAVDSLAAKITFGVDKVGIWC